MSRSMGAEDLHGKRAKPRDLLPLRVLLGALLLLVACSGSRVLDSPQEAQELVSFPVLVPVSDTLPAGVELEEVRWKHDREQNAEMVDLVYGGSRIELSTQQYARHKVRLEAPDEAHERVAVRGTTGYLYAQPTGEVYSLAWEENGTIVSVSTSGVTLVQMLTIIDSMKAVAE